MTIDIHQERAPAPPREDARDLIARLCRELGLAAVTAELQEPQAQDQPLTPPLAAAASPDPGTPSWLLDDHLGANGNPVEQVDHINVEHADAA